MAPPIPPPLPPTSPISSGLSISAPTTASEYFKQLDQVLQSIQVTASLGLKLSLDQGSEQVLKLILGLGAMNRKAMVIGNGGSASIAGHMVNDLSKAVGVRAMALTEISTLTALTNDLGYDVAYQKQVEQWAEPGDLLVAISSSGKSANILNAVTAAQKAGCNVVTLSGFAATNPLRQSGELNFYVPADTYGMVELAHQVLAHQMTDAAMAAVSQRQGDVHGLALEEVRSGDRRSGLRRRRASA